jgi:hypothetical protein
MVIYQNQLFEHFETLVVACKWIYTCVDNRQVPVPHSKNCPTVKYPQKHHPSSMNENENEIIHENQPSSFMKIMKIFIPPINI